MEKSFNSIEDNIKGIRAQVEEAAAACGRNPAEISLMAVTKTQTPQAVNQVIAQGVKLLGENRAQELCARYDGYEKEGVSIHFIGHLQRNKVRQVIDKVDMIHSVDSLRLAQEIDRQAGAVGKRMDVLVEVNVGGEESKSGVEPEQAKELAQQLSELENLRLRGLMTIPPVCDEVQAERYFSHMAHLLVDIRDKNRDNMNVDTLSMGMSGDFAAAIRQGATIIRIGTALFGSRDYTT